MKATLEKEPRSTGNHTQYQEFVAPPVNIFETKDGYVLEAEMPGVNKEGLEISIEKNELSIVGRRSNPAPQGTLLHRESRPRYPRDRPSDR